MRYLIGKFIDSTITSIRNKFFSLNGFKLYNIPNKIKNIIKIKKILDKKNDTKIEIEIKTK